MVDRNAHTPGKVKSLNELDGLPLFFIIGRGRSGSTLLRSMLDAHPSVMIPLESRFIQFLYYNFPAKGPWTSKTALQALDALESGFEPLNLQRDSLLEEIERLRSGLNLSRFCKLIYLHTRSEYEKEKIRILGDKNPRYSFFIPQLHKLFPEAKFIHLVRDYRDNIVAVQRAGKLIRESGNPYFALGRWRLYNRQVLKYQEKNPDSFQRVHFEELIRNPKLVMQKLCRFLDVDYYPGMLDYHKQLGRNFEEQSFSQLHKSLRTPFDPSKIGEWKGLLPGRTALRCEVLGGRFAVKIGYPPQLEVFSFRRALIWCSYIPIMLMGQFRFLIKILFFRSRLFMRMAYMILLKIK
jgi:hypothetical protein